MTTGITLGDLSGFDSTEKAYPALVGRNMGHQTLKLNLSIQEVIDRTRVYNEKTVVELGASPEDKIDAQRPLYESHAKGLAKYVVIGLVETNIRRLKRSGKSVPQRIIKLQEQLGFSEYSCLQPFVANIRDCEPDGLDLGVQRINEESPAGIRELEGVIRVVLTAKHIMSVVDGQHRRYAFGLVMAWLSDITSTRKYPIKGIFNPKDTFNSGDRIDQEIYDFWVQIHDIAVRESFVCIECHLGATAEQERQIFSDLNSKGKKVELSQSLEYDSSDSVNSFIKEELLEASVIQFETKTKDTSNWAEDDGKLLRKDLNPVTSLALFGKGSAKTATPSEVKSNKGVAKKFWSSIQRVKGFGKPNARLKTIAAQPVVLKGIARLAYDLAFGKSGMANENHLAKLWDAIETGKLDFSHTNKLWRALMMTAAERKKNFLGFLIMYMSLKEQILTQARSIKITVGSGTEPSTMTSFQESEI